MIYLFTLLFILNFIFIFYFKKIANIINLFDYPDSSRKLHTKPVPAIGGVLILLNFSVFFFFYLFNQDYYSNVHPSFSIKDFKIFYIFSLIFFSLGFLDDKFKLGPNVKLVIYSVLIYLLVFFSNKLLLKSLTFSFFFASINVLDISIFLTILCFLLFINAFNMFDGINGQSGMYAIFVFFLFIIKDVFVLYSLTIVISLICFLYLNFKRKCFLGNNGSLLLSFIIAYLFLNLSSFENIFYADQIFLIMAIPGFDLFRLALQRILNNKHPFHPDKNHIHHILLDKFGLIKTLAILLSLIIVPNILSIYLGWTLSAVFLTLIIYLFLIYNDFRIGRF